MESQSAQQQILHLTQMKAVVLRDLERLEKVYMRRQRMWTQSSDYNSRGSIVDITSGDETGNAFNDDTGDASRERSCKRSR